MKFVSSLLLVLFTNAVHATTYYISNTGNNRYDGLTPATAWQTMARVQIAANSGLVKAGDKFLFKKGDSFSGTLTWANIFGNKAPSGTANAPIVFSSYGTGAKPLFQYHSDFEKNPEKKILFFVAGVNHIIFDGLNITDLVFSKDDKVSPANCGIAFNFGSYGDATCNHCTVKNTDMSNIGMGIVMIGDSNRVDSCSFVDLKNVRNTYGNNFPENDDDYGANGVTITGNDNLIAHSFFSGNWAESYDYGFSGGAIESFGSSSRNRIVYNTIIDCNGVMEIGSSKGGMAADDLLANNLLINNGGLTYVNISGTFAIEASNVQYFNNTIINTGDRYKDKALFTFNGKPEAKTLFNIRNNVFYLTNGIAVVRDETDLSKYAHDNNLFEFKGGSKTNFQPAGRDMLSTSSVFVNDQDTDIVKWDLNLKPQFVKKKSGHLQPYSESDLNNDAATVIPVTPLFAAGLAAAFYASVVKNDQRRLRWLMRIIDFFIGDFI